jgi:excisionase family DNA binding protein
VSESVTLSLPPAAVEVFAERAAAIVLAQLGEHDASSSEWPEWMSVETAARYLDASKERVRKLKERREIPYYQEGPGCRVFFRRSELDAWMDGFRQRDARVDLTGGWAR